MHEHPHPPTGTRHLGIALGITASFFIIEVVGGIIANSLALLTDAWHMLNDTFALILALTASWLAQRPITMRRTYGYYRAEVLAAFVNGILLWGVVVFTLYEALQRILRPVEVESLSMLTIAVLGLVSNGLSAVTLSRSGDESLNVKGALLHVVADTLGSVGAICAGLIMFFTGWYQADPLISMVMGALIFYSSGRLIRDSANVLLEGVPSHIDVTAVERRIVGLKGVESVHDLHVWGIAPPEISAMSAHVLVKEGTDRKELIATLMDVLRDEFGIDHITVQLEEKGYPKAISEH